MTWRPPDREDRQVAGLWAICAALALGLRPLWLAGASLLPPCPWHTWTGWPCPGCGTTRALSSLLHADVLSALAFNPAAATGAATFVAGGVVAPIWFACGGQAPCLPTRPRPVGVGIVAGGLLANWVWLCASGV
jgi:hypothetical protein